jgi:hypothetical protein
MITYGGVEAYLHLGTLTPLKELPVLNGQEVGWAAEPVRTIWKRKKLLLPCRISNTGPPTGSPLLHRLSYRVSSLLCLKCVILITNS